jgi:hypothetical protein
MIDATLFSHLASALKLTSDIRNVTSRKKHQSHVSKGET